MKSEREREGGIPGVINFHDADRVHSDALRVPMRRTRRRVCFAHLAVIPPSLGRAGCRGNHVCQSRRLVRRCLLRLSLSVSRLLTGSSALERDFGEESKKAWKKIVP